MANCVNCGAPMHAGSDGILACAHCGSTGEICKQSMQSHLFGGPGNFVLDTCERCQVNWLDADELSRIARAP